MHKSKAGYGRGGPAMVRVDRKCESKNECVGIDVGVEEAGERGGERDDS